MEVSNTIVTRYDLSCPDEELKEILGTIVCCTDCGFAFTLEENELVIINKQKEYRVDISKYLDDTRVTDFKIDGSELILSQSDNTEFIVPLVDLINQTIHTGTLTSSSSGLSTEITLFHNLGFIPMYFTMQVNSKDAQGYSHVTALADKFVIWYDTAPKVGQNNLQYNWIVRI